MSVSVNDIQNLPVRTAFLTTSTAGVNSVVAAIPGKAIRVLSATISALTANNLTFVSDSTFITGTFALGAAATVAIDFNSYGLFQTAVGEALGVFLSAATLASVTLTYIEV